MDDQRNWIAARKFLCPTDDELYRIVIEIPLLERRRIHRIEQLLDLIDKNFDSIVRFLLRLQVGRFIQAVVTTAAQALRKHRGLFGLFLPTEIHFRFP